MTGKTSFCNLVFIFLLSFNGFSQLKDTTANGIRFFNKTEAGVSFGLGSFKTDVVNGIQEECERRQYRVLLAYSRNDPDTGAGVGRRRSLPASRRR